MFLKFLVPQSYQAIIIRYTLQRNIYVTPVVRISPLLGSNVTYDDSMNSPNIVWLAPLPSNSTKLGQHQVTSPNQFKEISFSGYHTVMKCRLLIFRCSCSARCPSRWNHISISISHNRICKYARAHAKVRRFNL